MLDVRKAAARGASVSGALKPHQLQRLRAVLASDEGEIGVELAFSRDEENRYLVQVKVNAELTVTCQRCLESMSSSLSSDNTLGIVWTDEQAAQLPRYLDPLLVAEEGCNLWDLAEDELILALPAFSYHETDNCNELLASYTDTEPDAGVDDGKPNPFDVLAQLKSSKEH